MTITLPAKPERGYLLIVIPRDFVPVIAAGNGAKIFSQDPARRWHETDTVTITAGVARVDLLWDGAHWFASGI